MKTKEPRTFPPPMNNIFLIICWRQERGPGSKVVTSRHRSLFGISIKDSTRPIYRMPCFLPRVSALIRLPPRLRPGRYCIPVGSRPLPARTMSTASLSNSQKAVLSASRLDLLTSRPENAQEKERHAVSRNFCCSYSLFPYMIELN